MAGVTSKDQNLRKVQIEFPFPGSALHAHTSGVRWTKVEATKRGRIMGHVVGANAIERGLFAGLPMERACVSYGFWLPDRKRRDVANLIQSCKPYIDGLVDAGILLDDCWLNLYVGSAYANYDRAVAKVGLVIMVFEEISEIPAPSIFPVSA